MQRAARRGLHRALRVREAGRPVDPERGRDAQGQTGLDIDVPDGAVLPQPQRRRVAGGGEGHRAGGRVVHADETGDQVFALEDLGERREVLEHVAGLQPLDGVAAQRRPQLAHHGRGAHAAPHHVADGDGDAPARQRDDVVPVATHLAAGRAGQVAARHVELGEPREPGGQQRPLELEGDVALALVQARVVEGQRGPVTELPQEADLVTGEGGARRGAPP